MKDFIYHAKNEEDTAILANFFSTFLKKGDLVLLNGDLGSGKTFFVKKLTQNFNSTDVVTSPTFNIANFYDIKEDKILHIDLYRLSEDEFRELGLEDYIEKSITLIEWGQKISDDFFDYLSLNFEHVKENKTGRKITIKSTGSRFNDIDFEALK